MRLPEVQLKLKEEFDQTWGNAKLQNEFELDLQVQLAKCMLSEETDEYHKSLQAKADKDHEEKMSIFERAISGDPNVDGWVWKGKIWLLAQRSLFTGARSF